jgi:hypothetical protein
MGLRFPLIPRLPGTQGGVTEHGEEIPVIRAIKDVLTINMNWDRSRAWTRILRFAGLLLLLALPLNSFAQAHLLRQRPFRASEDQRSGGDHICDLRSDSDEDGKPDRLGDYVCISGTVIAGPSTYEREGRLFWIRNRSCGMLVYGSAEPLRVGDSVTVDGHLRLAGRGEIFGECGLEAIDGCGVKKVGLELRGIRPNIDPVPVKLRDYCLDPWRYIGNLIEISDILYVQPAGRDGENSFFTAGDGRDSILVYVDGDTFIDIGPGASACYTLTGILLRVHTPACVSIEPAWCLAPRFQDDVVWTDCATEAALTTWGEIKTLFSD